MTMTSVTSVEALQDEAPFGLEPTFSKRIWGKTSLEPWYTDLGTTEPVGEAWLTGPESVIASGKDAGKMLSEVAGDFPLLVKMLFPSDKLSVQVHPDDDEAQAMGHARGKTECWYVLEAVPGATVALGVKDGVTKDDLQAAASSMEELIEQVPVEVGDMVFVDAGTVHAIGPGVVLLEVQQTSDLTYRLYDYGRPRELHLTQGLAVTKTETRAGKVPARPMDGFVRLIEERYFVVDRFECSDEVLVPFAGIGCLVGLTGSGTVRTAAGEVALTPGRAVICPIGDVSVLGDAVGFVRCVAPE
ncbi:Mannose-6-phosphate isomerase [Granulicella sibirica]|uniref:Mannose-6-phosphate isomerase n=2 Tax=Granulicella sibirica TaxID=2479048 RepID=A0A4Q0T0U5_9BACT|nr:Mannose-6-phosphate isomerase [Granulicella sibirica]